MQVVYKSARYEIELHNPQHSKLVVTFDTWQLDKVDFLPPKPLQLIADAGMAEMRLKTHDNDWFLSDELDEMMRVVSETAGRYADVINYGSSMGGFGALLFSRSTGAREVYLISPQHSVDRLVVPFETRWEKEAAELRLPAIEPQAFGSPEITGIVVFDPAIPLDRLQAEAVLRAFPRLKALKLPFSGHPASKVLHEAGLFGNMGRDVVNGRATARSIRALFNLAKRQSPRYWLQLGIAHMERRPELARHAFREVLARADIAKPGNVFRAGAKLSELGDQSAATTMRDIYDAAERRPHWWDSALRRVEKKAARAANRQAGLTGAK